MDKKKPDLEVSKLSAFMCWLETP